MKLPSILLLVVAVLAVYWQAAFQGIRELTGAQPELLPPLVVYAALRLGVPSVLVLSVVGGLLLDSLSANPLGITMVPLAAVGLAIHGTRDNVIQDQPFAQGILGAAAGLGSSGLTLLLLLTSGNGPVIGPGTVWQLVFIGASAAIITPVFFAVLEWLHKLFSYGTAPETSFRQDREIRRGRI